MQQALQETILRDNFLALLPREIRVEFLTPYVAYNRVASTSTPILFRGWHAEEAFRVAYGNKTENLLAILRREPHTWRFEEAMEIGEVLMFLRDESLFPDTTVVSSPSGDPFPAQIDPAASTEVPLLSAYMHSLLLAVFRQEH